MMVDRKSSKYQFVAGILLLLCGILMVCVQLSGWAMYGEKLHLGAAVVFLSLGTVFVGASRHRKGDK